MATLTDDNAVDGNSSKLIVQFTSGQYTRFGVILGNPVVNVHSYIVNECGDITNTSALVFYISCEQ